MAKNYSIDYGAKDEKEILRTKRKITEIKYIN